MRPASTYDFTVDGLGFKGNFECQTENSITNLTPHYLLYYASGRCCCVTFQFEWILCSRWRHEEKAKGSIYSKFQLGFKFQFRDSFQNYWSQKKIKFYERDIMQLFSVDATIFFKKI